MSQYQFKVTWCRVCDQGWVEIVKETQNSTLLLQCSECLSQWSTPGALENQEFMEDEVTVSNPTYDEVKSLGWDKYVLIE